MRLVARFFLWLIGVAIPVFIAACYGAPYRFSRYGWVKDRTTRSGINGIEITCLIDGQPQSSTFSRDDDECGPGEDCEPGWFEIDPDVPCDELRLRDVDGMDNGGQYETRTVPFPAAELSAYIELVRVK